MDRDMSIENKEDLSDLNNDRSSKKLNNITSLREYYMYLVKEYNIETFEELGEDKGCPRINMEVIRQFMLRIHGLE